MSSADVETHEEVPKSRRLVDSILTSLASYAAEIPAQRNVVVGSSPRSATRLFEQEALKPHFLTLHLLLPHLLLDALDLLDRGLVIRLRVQSTQWSESKSENQATRNHRCYYVRSAQVARQGRHRSNISGIGSDAYQVHLTAWSCSCAAFAFAFAQASEYSSSDLHQTQESPILKSVTLNDGKIYQGFGGLGALLGGHDEMPPVCKHLLACTLAETCEAFFGVRLGSDSEHEISSDEPHPGIVEYYVSPNEAAAWAAR